MKVLATLATLITVIHVHQAPHPHAAVPGKPPQSDFWKNYSTYGGLCKLSVVACLPRGWKDQKK